MKRTDLNSQTAREAFDRLHPQPVREGMPEKLEVHSTGLLPMKAEIHPINDPDGLIILADVQTMELATEICKRYNAYEKLVELLRRVQEMAVHKDGELNGNRIRTGLFKHLKEAPQLYTDIRNLLDKL